MTKPAYYIEDCWIFRLLPYSSRPLKEKKSQPAGVPTHVQLRKLFLVVDVLVTSAACHWFMHTSLLHGDLTDFFKRCIKFNEN